MYEKIFNIALYSLAALGFAFTIWATIHCWNVPIGARTGMCAMLH